MSSVEQKVGNNSANEVSMYYIAVADMGKRRKNKRDTGNKVAGERSEKGEGTPCSSVGSQWGQSGTCNVSAQFMAPCAGACRKAMPLP